MNWVQEGLAVASNHSDQVMLVQTGYDVGVALVRQKLRLQRIAYIIVNFLHANFVT